MADCAEVALAVITHPPVIEEQEGGDGGGGSERDEGGGLTDAQMEVLERCLHALRQAQNDSHTLAALLLVSVSLLKPACTGLTISLVLGSGVVHQYECIYLRQIVVWHRGKYVHSYYL